MKRPLATIVCLLGVATVALGLWASLRGPATVAGWLGVVLVGGVLTLIGLLPLLRGPPPRAALPPAASGRGVDVTRGAHRGLGVGPREPRV